VTHNEYWTAAASASGLPYGEDAASVSFSGCPGSATSYAVSRVVSDMRTELNDNYAIPLMLLQSSADCTVLQQAALNRPAASGGAVPRGAAQACRACSAIFASAIVSAALPSVLMRVGCCA